MHSDADSTKQTRPRTVPSMLATKKYVSLFAAFFLALTGSLFTLLPGAGAVTSTRTWSLTGGISIGQIQESFPVGSTFTATYDSDTGALTNGSLSVPEYTTSLSGASISLTLSDVGDATGTILSDGTATINESVTATLNIDVFGAPCPFGPMAITLSTANAGGSGFTSGFPGGPSTQGSPATGTLTGPFTVPSATVGGLCTAQNQGYYDQIGLPYSGLILATLTQTADVLPTTTTSPASSTTAPGAVDPASLAATGSPMGLLLGGASAMLALGAVLVARARARARILSGAQRSGARRH